MFNPVVATYAQEPCVQLGMITSFSESKLYEPIIEEYKEPPVFKDKYQKDFFRGKKHKNSV